MASNALKLGMDSLESLAIRKYFGAPYSASARGSATKVATGSTTPVGQTHGTAKAAPAVPAPVSRKLSTQAGVPLTPAEQEVTRFLAMFGHNAAKRIDPMVAAAFAS